MTTVLKEDKYYEDKPYNEQYIKVMNEDSPSSSFDMGTYRYYDDLNYNEHFKKVMKATREDFDLPLGKYYENEAFNEQFTKVMSSDNTVTISPTPTTHTKYDPTDVVFTVTGNNTGLKSVLNNNKTVSPKNYSQDMTVTPSTISIKATYLDSLPETTEPYEFKFIFNNTETVTASILLQM